MQTPPIPAINRSLSTLFITLAVLISVPAHAEYVGTNSAPSGPTANTGRRGSCSGESATDLTALAPQNHVGQTVSSHPTLAWYVPEATPTPLEVAIYNTADGENAQAIYKAELISTPGIMTLTLPDDQPGLETGNRYTWQVVLLCNPNRPSSALITSAELEVVPHSAALDAQLRQLAETEYVDLGTLYQQRSDLYAEAGLWYDAFADAIRQTVPENMTAVTELLDDLNALETAQDPANEPFTAIIAELRSQP